ncbi:ATP-binding protein [Hespellia stercorisuis]|uniref:Circadian input-output histidine kinase CikA n=1 Tax=Hespellia stercorisuis DSM 15480 TaxID=1121950 RepID=A0A1M6UC61_9FIRM|nr:ATP-binding protein [Hespellia stercorisuis]SHK66804.1 Signal transduction histidine kinase [Hespellia stercorisuis DSM 15480]
MGKMRRIKKIAVLMLVLGSMTLPAALPALAVGDGLAEQAGNSTDSSWKSGGKASQNVTLTKEERKYIKRNPTISIAMDTSWIPYAFNNDSTGEVDGIIPNLLDKVAENTGLRVNYISKDTYADAIAAVQSGETLLVSGIADDPSAAERNDVLITDPYMTVSYSSVTKGQIPDLYEKGASYRVAVCAGSYSTVAMKAKMPTYQFVEYHSNDECMRAVEKGEVDIALLATCAAEYYGTRHEYSAFNIGTIVDFSWGLCFGVNKECDPMLIEILNKGIAGLTPNDKNQASYNAMIDANGATKRFYDWVYEQPVLAAMLAAGGTAMLLIIIFLIIHQKGKIKALKQTMLQENIAVLEAAMRSGNVEVWNYDTKTKQAVRYTSEDNLMGAGEKVENVPDSMIENGMVHPDSEQVCRDLYVPFEKDDRTRQADLLLRDSKSRNYWWERVILAPVRDESGNVQRVIGMSVNVTEHKEKEARYLRLLEQMEELETDSLIAKGRHNLTKNTVLYYREIRNEAVSVREGGSYDEMVGILAETAFRQKKAEELCSRLSRESLTAGFARGETSGEIQYKREEPSGASIWAATEYTLSEDPNTEDLIAFIYSYDITEHVIESKIVSKLSNIEYDMLGLLDVNTGLYVIRGAKPGLEGPELRRQGNFEEASQRRFAEVGMPAEKEQISHLFSVADICVHLEKLELYYFTYFVLGRDGENLRKKMQFSYLDETRTTILFFRSDITDMYQKEQEQLRQTENALEAAKKASSAKTEFFSRMSHDMRTPMNGILGLVALSEEETSMEILRQNIHKIRQPGEYLLGLINDTLDFQRIESGRMTIEPQIIKGTELLDSVMDMVRQNAEKKGVELRVITENAELDEYVRVDPMRIKQVFVNLLSNAVKFTPAGGTVEFIFESVRRNEMISRDRILVRDNGIGMSPEFLKDGIFQPFSQENNGVSSQFAGSGLGLSITKNLVEMMGGTIEVESELGVGTTFRMEIDFERVDRSVVKDTRQADQKHRADLKDLLKNRRILLVEDQPLNAEIAKRLLERAGCQVVWEQNGKLGVERFQQSPEGWFDTILMDIRMPVMNGLEATETIRGLDRPDAATVPIIAMTANAYDSDVKLSIEKGMNAHLSKPIEPDLLFATIERFLSERECE